MSNEKNIACSHRRTPELAVATPEMVHAAVGISSADSIKVAVRVRPLNSKEVAANIAENVTVSGVRFWVFVHRSPRLHPSQPSLLREQAPPLAALLLSTGCDSCGIDRY